jgi:hypothetical protein
MMDTTVPEIKTEPDILWIVYGVVYVIVITILNIPKFVEWFPPASASTIVVSPLFGLSFLLRDAVQYTYENTREKKAKSSGFWISMVFVGLGVLGNILYADPITLLPSVVAFVAGSVVDGVAFSMSKAHSLGYRLLYSNVWAGIVNTTIFVTLAYGLAYMNFEIFWNVLLPKIFMQILPGLLLFLLGSTMIAKALGLADFGIIRRIHKED